MTAIPTVCILAGGLGTRLGPLAEGLPKALIDVNGEPFVFHQLRSLAEAGVRSAVLCVGHLGEMIESTVGSERFGVNIAYSFDGPGLDGTLGAVRRASNMLGERFLVTYGDTLLTVDLGREMQAWAESGAPAVMSVLHNNGRWDASNADCDAGLVVEYDKSRSSRTFEWIDYGMNGLSTAALSRGRGAKDLAELWSDLAAERLLAAFTVDERFYEIGTPEALEETREHLVAFGVRPNAHPDGDTSP